MNNDNMVTDINTRVADMLRVLSAVGSGEYTNRLAADLPSSHPLAALYVGVNEMIEALALEQQRAVEYQRDLEDKLNTIEQQRAAIRELST
ncbi:MAG: hypothetical protein ABI134_34250, partial [Byssovorax sp.]